MRLRSILSVACCMFALSPFARAADAPKTFMAEPGKELANDSFSSEIPAEWKVAKGTWAIVDGALKGTEKAEDMHAAVLRREAKVHNFVARYSFRFDGAKNTAFSINDSKGHVCRVAISPAGFALNKDKANKTSTDKAQSLDKVAMPIKAGEWYTITVEVVGKDFLATIGDAVAVGSNDGIDIDKTTIAFPVAGNGVSIKDFGLWEATAKSDWEATKAKLMAGKTKQAAVK